MGAELNDSSSSFRLLGGVTLDWRLQLSKRILVQSAVCRVPLLGRFYGY